MNYLFNYVGYELIEECQILIGKTFIPGVLLKSLSSGANVCVEKLYFFTEAKEIKVCVDVMGAPEVPNRYPGWESLYSVDDNIKKAFTKVMENEYGPVDIEKMLRESEFKVSGNILSVKYKTGVKDIFKITEDGLKLL